MSIKEQQEVRDKYYSEAVRYMNNAKEVLKKAGKDGAYYKDKKYVKMACGTAYNGVLLALDGYLLLKGIEKKRGRKNIGYYQSNITKIDRKLLYNIDDVYEILHLSGYYDGIRSEKIVKSGFEIAYTIINKIKP
ncbi:MAG: DUF5618 family protein [Bacteroidales bacterium]|nr:DUF5618 family protein [Bacteroidales bacterium]